MDRYATPGTPSPSAAPTAPAPAATECSTPAPSPSNLRASPPSTPLTSPPTPSGWCAQPAVAAPTANRRCRHVAGLRATPTDIREPRVRHQGERARAQVTGRRRWYRRGRGVLCRRNEHIADAAGQRRRLRRATVRGAAKERIRR